MGMQLFTNAHIATGEPGSTAAQTAPVQDILVQDGRFVEFGEHLGERLAAQGCDKHALDVVDLGGKLVCPPFCDTHLHLDYVFTARKPGAVNESGTLFEGIQRWSETKSDLTVDEVKHRAKIGIAKEMRHGVQFIRTHADVTDPNLTSLKALLELKEELADTVTLQIVSFPQEGMYSYEGPHGETGADLVEEGLKMGADCVGGIPHFEQCREFGERSMHTVVELASRYGKLIDVHCDETDDPNSRYVELLAALAYKAGIGERTTASHTCSLGSTDNAYFFHLTKLLKAAKLNFACAPTENLYLQGRQDTFPKRRGITRVKELTEAGVNVSLGQDSMQDPWYPLGNGNMMLILDYVLHLAQMMSFEEIDDALKFLTINGATSLGMRNEYGLEPGKPANFIVLDADSVFNAVYERADVLRSVRAGHTLFTRTTTIDTELNLLR
ncbi:amidohydrolase family protein [Bifidobacterium oedipodis]|uniref:Cytosine deaminase n=1 Tax=Bifidobacterium oedipodis TaxID=2675322 RepID=A0A7Y0HR48_9BIFI|nr:amidohydrolase family protein [Bifidobacterium sp. DSM 109957]NMM93630.1 cytosine deaminase [Bifidobacterium sp. DSM 109957]